MNSKMPRDESYQLHVCLLVNQIGFFGKIGGFGTGARALATALVDRGCRVSVVVPRQKGQPKRVFYDGVEIIGLSIWQMLLPVLLLRRLDANVYHSHEPTWHTFVAQVARPSRVHVVTCVDPRTWKDMWIELRFATAARRLRFPLQWFYELQPLVKFAVRRASVVTTPAPTFLLDKTMQLYGLKEPPRFVPTAYIREPSAPINKALNPTFVFVGRWDRRKRFDLFLDLAEMRPDYQFIAVGRAHEPREDARLRALSSSIPNVVTYDFQSVFDGTLWSIYDEAWALVNTSAREGLPLTFFEALSRGCALVSFVNPEELPERFGVHVKSGDAGEMARALDRIVAWGRNPEIGNMAKDYALRMFGPTRMLESFLTLYVEPDYVLDGHS